MNKSLVLAALLVGCGGAQSGPSPIENTAEETAPDSADPTSEADDEQSSDTCGCVGYDDYNELNCPEGKFGPASKACADNPGTKYCGCPGDSPCGGLDGDGGDNPCNPCVANPCDPCGDPCANPCWGDPCGDPCGNPCAP